MSRSELQDEVLGWLGLVEQEIDCKGWGNSPRELWFCATTPMGKDSSDADITAIALVSKPFPALMSTVEVTFLLRELFQYLCENPGERVHMMKNCDGGELFALALSGESLSIPPQDMNEWRGRNWNEHPRRREKRFVLAVDIHGHRYLIQRDRLSNAVHTGTDTGPLGSMVPKLLELILQALLQ